MQNLFGTDVAQCTKGWESRCANAQCPECKCNCGGANHGTKNHDYELKITRSIRDKRCMFYLTKKDIADIKVGDPCIVLADFSGIKAGERGKVIENYKTGVMVEWQDREDSWIGEPRKPQSDGFGDDELEYLAFGTPKHPTKGK